jgi:hypothetical protein
MFKKSEIMILSRKGKKEAFRLMLKVLKDLAKTLYDPYVSYQQLLLMMNSEARLKIIFKYSNLKLISCSDTEVFSFPIWDPILLPSLFKNYWVPFVLFLFTNIFANLHAMIRNNMELATYMVYKLKKSPANPRPEKPDAGNSILADELKIYATNKREIKDLEKFNQMMIKYLVTSGRLFKILKPC